MGGGAGKDKLRESGRCSTSTILISICPRRRRRLLLLGGKNNVEDDNDTF